MPNNVNFDRFLEQPSMTRLPSGSRYDDLETPQDEINFDQYLDPTDEVSSFESFLRGAGQGVTFGFEDEIRGAVLGGFDALTSGQSYSDAYTNRRDNIRNLNQQARDANPGTYLSGELTGGLVSGIATAPLGGVGTGASMARIGTTLAAQGAAAGLGYSEADSVGSMALDTAIGAGVAGTLGVAGTSAARAIGNRLSNSQVFRTITERLPSGVNAVKVGDMMRGRAVANANKVLGTARLNLPDDEAAMLGRLALDEGLLRNPSPDAIRRSIVQQNNSFNESLVDRNSPMYQVVENVATTRNNVNNIAARVTQEQQVMPTDSIERLGSERFVNELNSLIGKTNEVEGTRIATAITRLANKSNFASTTPTREEQVNRIAYGRMVDTLSDAINETDTRVRSTLATAIPDSANTRTREVMLNNMADMNDLLSIHRQQIPLITTNSNLARLTSTIGTEIDTITPRIDDGMVMSGASTVLGSLGAASATGQITDDPTLQMIMGGAGAVVGNRVSPVAARELNKLATRATTTGLDRLGRAISNPTRSTAPTHTTGSDLSWAGRFAPILERAKLQGGHQYTITYQALMNQNEDFRQLVRDNDTETD